MEERSGSRNAPTTFSLVGFASSADCPLIPVSPSLLTRVCVCMCVYVIVVVVLIVFFFSSET